MAINLKTIDERLAKAKEEAEFWEKARAVLADPRLKDISDPQPRNTIPDLFIPADPSGPRAYGEVRDRVNSVLPHAEANIGERLTTQQIVATLQRNGYVFRAKDPTIAVNGALAALEEKELAEWAGRRGNAKLWRKKKVKSQEAPEGAS